MKLLYSAICISLAFAGCKSEDKNDAKSDEAAKSTESAAKDGKAPESKPEATKVSPEPVEKAAPVDEKLAKRCSAAMAKVSLDAMMAEMSKPSKEEQAVMDMIRKLAVESCIKEGLSAEQSACFDAIVDVKSLLAVVDCPAIAAKKPNWLRSYTLPKSEKEEAK